MEVFNQWGETNKKMGGLGRGSGWMKMEMGNTYQGDPRVELDPIRMMRSPISNGSSLDDSVGSGWLMIIIWRIKCRLDAALWDADEVEWPR